MITPEEQVVLRDFAEVANRNGVPFVLVGAGARLVVFDWKYQLQSTRTTTDWDIGVQIGNWEAFEQLREALTRGNDPLFVPDTAAHRFRHRTGIAIDMVPFGGIEHEDGTIVWPHDERQMLMLGFQEVLANAVTIDVGQGVRVPAATAPGLAVLKVFAFHDRHRGDDLQDMFIRHLSKQGESS